MHAQNTMRNKAQQICAGAQYSTKWTSTSDAYTKQPLACSAGTGTVPTFCFVSWTEQICMACFSVLYNRQLTPTRQNYDKANF